MSVTLSDVRARVRSLGLSGLAVCVHASLRSFGWVEGGARAVVDGLLAERCTVLVPTFTHGFQAPAPAERRMPRNGWDYARAPDPGWVTDRAYSVDATDCEEGMGAIPREIAAMPDRARGDHPLNSFCAVGPLAGTLVAGQAPLAVYRPFEELIARGGWVLMMAVNLKAMTLVHLAEERAGRSLFRRWAVDPGRRPVECAVGSCSQGFERLRPFVERLVRATTVGASRWEAFPAGALVDAVAAAIRDDPTITHCGGEGCRCDDAVAGGPMLTPTG